MIKRKLLLVSILTIMTSACHNTPESAKSNNDELELILNEFRLTNLKSYATDPERYDRFYESGNQIIEIGNKFNLNADLTSDTFSVLKNTYQKTINDFYSHLSDDYTLYGDTIRQYLNGLAFDTERDKVIKTIKLTSILAFMDLQNHLMARTIFVDGVRFHTKETLIKNKTYVQVLPTVVNNTQNVRFIINSDTIFTPIDSLLIPLEEFKKKPTIKLDFMTRNSRFEEVKTIK